MQGNIQVFGTTGCPYCIRIKQFLNDKGLKFTERLIKIGVPNHEMTIEQRDNLKVLRDAGLDKIPQIFIDGKLIGGCEDTEGYLNSVEETKETYVDFSEFDEEVEEEVVKPVYRNMIKKPELQKGVVESLTHIQNICHGLAREGGWWDRKGTALEAHNLLESGEPQSEAAAAILRRVADQERNPLELIALMHSELSETLEGVRKDQMDDKLTHRLMEEVELADTIVRILDYAGGRKLDVAGALVEKLVFNITREDHQVENRIKAGGKKY